MNSSSAKTVFRIFIPSPPLTRAGLKPLYHVGYGFAYNAFISHTTYKVMGCEESLRSQAATLQQHFFRVGDLLSKCLDLRKKLLRKHFQTHPAAFLIHRESICYSYTATSRYRQLDTSTFATRRPPCLLFLYFVLDDVETYKIPPKANKF